LVYYTDFLLQGVFYPTYAPGGGQLRLLLYTDTGLHFDNLRTGFAREVPFTEAHVGG
jgi:hypothetical protein